MQLIDRYGRRHDYLRISITRHCNLRCRYCMPAEGIRALPADLSLSVDEIERLVRVMATLGVRKVRLTGGEPTLHPHIIELVRRIAGISGIDQVAITTNGVRFGSLARPLRAAGLTSVNISLDSLDEQTFSELARRSELVNVLQSVDAALEAGFRQLKINTVIIRGVNDGELLDFVRLTEQRPINVRFIEYMPFKGNAWGATALVSEAEMKSRIEACYPLHLLPSTTENRVAEDYAVPGFRGSVSFIASMTRSFCDSCSRLRLTSDGALKACLFMPAQVSLRNMLRNGESDEMIARAIHSTLQTKWVGHPEPEQLTAVNDATMLEIGG